MPVCSFMECKLSQAVATAPIIAFPSTVEIWACTIHFHGNVVVTAADILVGLDMSYKSVETFAAKFSIGV
jgi:hypothetical protein